MTLGLVFGKFGIWRSDEPFWEWSHGASTAKRKETRRRNEWFGVVTLEVREGGGSITSC